MEKGKNNLTKILVPKDYVYLAVLFLMLFIFGLDDIKIAIPGLVLWISMFFLLVYMNKSEAEKIEKHIEKINFNAKALNNNSLSNFPLPMVTIELNGMIIWYNDIFQELIGKESALERRIFEFIEGINPDELIKDNEFIPLKVKVDDKYYQVIGNITKIDTKNKKERYAITLYFIDITDYNVLLKKYENEKPCIGVAIIDNYDELMQSIADEGRPQLLAEIDRKLNTWGRSN